MSAMAKWTALGTALLILALLPGCAPLSAGEAGEPRLAAADLSLGLSSPHPSAPPDPARAYRARARALAETLEPPDLAGQLMMVGIDGKGSLPPSARDLLAAVRPGGVVLFGFNVPEDPRALARYLGLLQDEAKARGLKAPVLAAIDHEGGQVFRFKRGLTRIPSARTLGALGEDAVERSGSIAGSELRALGITLNLAPVAEAAEPGAASFLGERAFSSNPHEAGALAALYVRRLQDQGVGAVLKHYPGSAALDPHKGLPVLDVDLPELERRYERPFAIALASGPAAVMLSQLSVPALDAENPVSWSPGAIARLRRLGFKGLVLTDDVAMKASLSLLSAEEAAVRAIQAGADMVMVSGGPYTARVAAALREAVVSGRIPRQRALSACANILAWKSAFALDEELDPALREARLETLSGLVASSEGAFAR